ncbi:hypothetical protein AAC387_Pa04g1510 [Persea americana]
MEAQRWFGWKRVQVGFACQFLPSSCQLSGLMIEDTGSIFQQRSPVANGSGWWDCDMEGVDSEEVGCVNTWEMASTTLGG